MTLLTAHLKHYIAVRRNLRYDLAFAEWVVRKFAEFAQSEHLITSPSISSYAGRSTTVRQTNDLSRR
jgi:hypothetical protein